MRLYAPHAAAVRLGTTSGARVAAEPAGAGWWQVADGTDLPLADGDVYGWFVDDARGTFGPLLDPSARQVRIIDGTPWNVVRSTWPSQAPLGWHHPQPVIYEAHVRGMTMTDPTVPVGERGTFAGLARRVDYLAGLGVQVLELMPVHPFDTDAPPSGNYWGYMPLVWGAVHEQYGCVDAAAELAELCALAHRAGIEVWLDVVFNHTGEGDASMPTRSLRGLVDGSAYRWVTSDSGPVYANDSGCGNDIDPADPYVRSLVLEALERFADLGVDGFRFDLASLLTRDGGALVERITEWAARRDVVLVAEPWDMGSYQVGAAVWPPAWLQWNDRFRDDVRGFVRAEPGLVGAVAQRLAASPDVFAARSATVNFVSAHDGLTLHDLTLVTSDRHRSWDAGEQLRLQMVRNLLTMLLLADGAAMFVMGDEFGRTQHGHDNPYDVDGPTTWMDWARLDTADGAALAGFTRRLIALRAEVSRRPIAYFGCDGGPADTTFDSRSIAWCTDDMFVAANLWWEPLTFVVPPSPRPWTLTLSTAAAHFDTTKGVVDVPPRSIAVLRPSEA